MILEFSFPDCIQDHIDSTNINPQTVARVISVHKDRYVISIGHQTYTAEVTGALRFNTQSSLDLPVVGDWVEMVPFDQNSAIIINILPRFSLLQRQRVGKRSEVQAIASNIDTCFVVMALNYDFNVHRLDRYISLCNEAEIAPIVILTKTDLLTQEEVVSKQHEVLLRFPSVEVVTTSMTYTDSYSQVDQKLLPGKTHCFVGSSGVGKTTIINHLLGADLLTSSISTSTQKGRHTTSHRELFHLDNGSMIVDTPGMRELGLTDSEKGLDKTFSGIAEQGEECRFADCTHTNEPGCAVLSALESGCMSHDEYDSYQKLQKEQLHFSETKRDKKRKGKELSRMVREVKSTRKRLKY